MNPIKVEANSENGKYRVPTSMNPNKMNEIIESINDV